MKNVKAKMPYFSDGEIYSLWKYLNGYRLVKKNIGILNFDDLIALGENSLFITKFLSFLKNLGIESLKGLVFHKDIYLKYNKEGYEELKKKKEKNDLDGINLKALELLEELLSGNPEIIYRNSLGIYDFVFYESRLGILEFFEFSANLPTKDREKIQKFIDAYIKNFINDNLEKDRKNFYCFDKQREKTIWALSEKEKDYGKSFRS